MYICKHCKSDKVVLKVEGLHHKISCRTCRKQYHIQKTIDNFYKVKEIDTGVKVNENKFDKFFH